MKINIPNVFKHGRKSSEKLIPMDEREPKAQGCQVATQRTITLTLTLPQFNLVGKALSLHSPIAYELNLELLRLLYAQESAYINGLEIVTKTLSDDPRYPLPKPDGVGTGHTPTKKLTAPDGGHTENGIYHPPITKATPTGENEE